MFTKNAVSHAYARTFGKYSSMNCNFKITNVNYEGWGSFDTVSCMLSLCDLMSRPHITSQPTSGSSIYVGGVIFGNGSTEPTVDDYKLSGNVVTGFTQSNTITMNYDSDTEVTSITKTYTITNTGNAEITISEVALLDSFKNGAWFQPFIIDRTLLDTPVTIPANGVGQVVYTINAAYPTV